MKESIEERIKLVKEAMDPESLSRVLCPFYELGGHPDCISCKKTMGFLEECKKIYLSRIEKYPMDIWEPEFDAYTIEKRDNKVPLDKADGTGIHCNSCYMSDKCPYYKEGFECAIEWKTEVPGVSEMYDFMIGLQYERVRRASVFEKIDGGVPDENLSKEMDRLSILMDGKANLSRESLSLRLDASGSSVSSGGGILAKIFGPKATPIAETPVMAIPEKAESVEDVPAVEIKKPCRVIKKA